MNVSWLGPIKQISFTTDDLDPLVRFWETQVGVGPWSVFRGLTLNMTYEGRPISLPFHVALSMHGETLIELIQVTGNGPSPFHDSLNRPIIGLQRLASLSHDIERDAASAVAKGMELFAEGRDVTGQRFYYFRSPAAPGIVLELLEATPFFNAFVDGLAARAHSYSAIACSTVTGEAVEAHAYAVAGSAPTGSMQAAHLHNYGTPDAFRIETIAEPSPGPGEIRVRVAGAAVNPVEIKARKGMLKDWVPLAFPAQLGGDVAGIVDAVGPGVTTFKPGDRVMGMVNPFHNGAYAEKAIFYATNFVHVPDELDLVDAAALPTGVLTGTQLIESGIRPTRGDKGLVIGASGSTGRAAIIAALDAGAMVYAGVRASSRDTVKDLPVAGVIDIADHEALAAAGPFDFLADTVGGEVAEGLFAYVKPAGVVASIANPSPKPPSESTQRFVSLIVRFDGPRLQRFAREMPYKIPMPVAHKLPLTEVAQAHRLMEQGGVGGKIVLVP
ncbi:Narbonolide/10-deoxymethynolide synthase PikA2, modules 3 and 4 [Pandoraea terrae]|uniref:Narbonolide/10-deoxymethynolide synthase PikA2, modules 3 and 4 n=1 Tax=Pandoraea terrae TaxID=1537710 RepID=A0A5E4VX37_9BURK|nr:zinc-binding dehydrogenase [Pandoraea terrae]VVE16721.1 Narbonolide/10-deoxymethynolide synthase PikA2, modules 3 and 4 [Pandoraea terrae]